MTSTVLVSRVCVSAGPRKLSSPESPGRPPPRCGPSSGQTSSGKRARRRSEPGPDSLAAAGPSVPVLAARRVQVPRAAPRCVSDVCPRGRSLHQGGALRLLAPVSSASGACPAPGSVCKISLPFFPCRQALVSTRLNFSSSRTRIASSPFSACSLFLAQFRESESKIGACWRACA